MKKYSFLLLPIIVLTALAFRFSGKIIVSGTITDEGGQPVSYASVKIKNSKTAVAADIVGSYKIEVSKQNDVLVFSAVGYISKEEIIAGKTIINVVLKKDPQSLQEAVVVGYGVDKKMDSNSLSDALSGRVSGFNIASSPSKNKFVREDESNTEEYSSIAENTFRKVSDEPLSTFSIDVDAASYSNVRRFINQNQLPPAGAVRTEEMINYFKYQYPQPTGKDPFSINTEMSDCPWNRDNKLVLIGLQGKNIPVENLPASNLVFLVDVSGSMQGEDRLGLVKQSLKMLTDQLREKDKITMVVYAGNAGLVLPATSGAEKIKIKTAIDALEAGGSTAGGAGILLAYKMAHQNFISGGNNRIILCTDGDFNVGVSSESELVRIAENERNKGVYLTVLGYGMGNYKDNKMQQLADKGNGNHAYIDNISEAKKVLVTEFGGTLYTIAKDVKLQVEFNPAKVAGYRLIGYENRVLKNEDFNDDKKDAGELGSGHTVTALYEIIPTGVQSSFLKNVDPLKYQKIKAGFKSTSFNDEILTVKFRYKSPEKDKSELIVHAVKANTIDFNSTSDNFRFAAAVSNFAMLLTGSEYKGSSSYNSVLNIAKNSLGNDAEGYRTEFMNLVKKVAVMADSKAAK